MTCRITIDPITRLEGHGKIEVFLDARGERGERVPAGAGARGFERFCVGRPAEEMPQLTAHVCGVSRRRTTSPRRAPSTRCTGSSRPPPHAASRRSTTTCSSSRITSSTTGTWVDRTSTLARRRPRRCGASSACSRRLAPISAGASSRCARRRASSWPPSRGGPSTRCSPCPAASPGRSMPRLSAAPARWRRGSSSSRRTRLESFRSAVLGSGEFGEALSSRDLPRPLPLDGHG